MTGAAEIVHSGLADEVWLVPCGPRPDKPKLKTPPIDRYCMCQIAVNTVFTPDFPVKVSDIECFSETAFPTYDLLCALRDRYPGVDFVFVIGSDWLMPGTNISQWVSRNRDWKPGDLEEQKLVVTGDKLLNEFDFLVIRRPGFEVARTAEDPSGLTGFGPRLAWLSMPENMRFVEGNLSSTEVRARIPTLALEGSLRTIQGLVPSGVLSYIQRAGLYNLYSQ